MASLFGFDSYRAFMAAKIRSYPRGGHGVMGKLAGHMGVHPSLVSQILKGGKGLTPDQALAGAEFFGLTDLESEYFQLLVQSDRAGTTKLKEYLRVKLAEVKERSAHLANRVNAERMLSEEARGIFYSDWIYTAVRQLTAIKGYDSPEVVSQKLGLPVKDVRKALDFLVLHGLCVSKGGRYKIGPQSSHLADTSPWARIHHKNWRLKAAERMDQRDPRAFFFSCPLTLAKNDVEKIRELVMELIEKVYKAVDPSPSEELCCLNIDWFSLSR